MNARILRSLAAVAAFALLFLSSVRADYIGSPAWQKDSGGMYGSGLSANDYNGPVAELTPAMMKLLIDATRHNGSPGLLAAPISREFGLGAGTIALPIAQAQTESMRNGVRHYVALSLMNEAKDVVIFRQHPAGAVDAFLTNSSRQLRAMVRLSADGRLEHVNIFRAAGAFQAELDLIGGEMREVLAQAGFAPGHHAPFRVLSWRDYSPGGAGQIKWMSTP